MNISSWSRHLHNDDFRPAAKSSKAPAGEVMLQGALAGAAVGAGVGAAIGYSNGLESLQNSGTTVTDQTYYSTNPVVVGAQYDDEDSTYSYDHFREEWRWQTDDDDWDAIIERSPVKAYQKPEFSNPKTSMVSSIAKGAVFGAVLGGVVGAVGASSARALGWQGIEAQKLLDDPTVAGVAGGAAGAVLGGVAGFHAGSVARANALVEVRTAPVYENQQIGWMPREWDARQISRDLGKGSGDFTIRYDELGGRYGNPPFSGSVPVYDKVPVGETSKEFRSSSLSPATGAIIGVGAGAALGVAIGISASLLNRVLQDN